MFALQGPFAGGGRSTAPMHGSGLGAREHARGDLCDAVVADWEAARRQEVADERFATLKRGYTVEIAGEARSRTAAVADARGRDATSAETAP